MSEKLGPEGISRRSALFVGTLGMCYARGGEREKALSLRKELEQRRATEEIAALCFCVLDLGLRDLDTAYQQLKAHLDEGGGSWGVEVSLGPVLDELEDDPRFVELFLRMHRPPIRKS